MHAHQQSCKSLQGYGVYRWCISRFDGQISFICDSKIPSYPVMEAARACRLTHSTGHDKWEFRADFEKRWNPPDGVAHD